MRHARVGLLSTLAVLSSCAPGGPHTRPGAPATEEQTPGDERLQEEPEYKAGLAAALATAPSEEAAQSVAQLFEAGYGIGVAEGYQLRVLEISLDRREGCLGALKTMKAKSERAVEFAAEACAELVQEEQRDVMYRGPLYANLRPAVVERAPREALNASLAGAAYDAGYEQGVASIYRKHPRATQTQQSAEQGCLYAFDMAAQGLPARAAWLRQLRADCPEIASKSTRLLNEIERESETEQPPDPP